MMKLCIGIDIGSTTAKVVVTRGEELLFRRYERHFSQVRQKTIELLKEAGEMLGREPVRVAISGSAGLGLAKDAKLEFIQEVFATGEAVKHYYPGTDTVIELGGEDAKILFLTGGTEERMNGSCAGGTGAFIDQMASLLHVTPQELDALSLHYEKIYPIASRCGVFAKTDIQPLLNQGARKEDVAMSIFQAVVDQTVTGLAQGREIQGKVAFLGGPLFFFQGLRQRFQETLHLSEENALFPELGQYTVALGAALYAEENAGPISCGELLSRLEQGTSKLEEGGRLPPLFDGEEEYNAFVKRHARASVELTPIEAYQGKAYLGIDCGSTTTKMVLLGENAHLLYQYYHSNQGNPVALVREQLLKLYQLCGDRITIGAAVATGYGEELIKSAFSADAGIVETMAHFRAARHFHPQVDFILDIGGQDIKCFQIKNNSVDSIMLNEACSSGCGSFIETFARSMNCQVEEFAQKGLKAKAPVDLGSRCTVFMNSSVKQAQKDGASVEDISAGLSMSVVKNALYKVIRANSAQDLGENIVVQGGTFLNNAVLRSFEKELGHPVVRPNIAGVMGAFGAALYGKSLQLERSSLLSQKELETFAHQAKPVTCNLCGNRCNLTVNTFSGGRRFLSGNRCERPLGGKADSGVPNLYAFKQRRIQALRELHNPRPARGRIGLPMGLNMYENLPFWHAFFTELGFDPVVSAVSSPELFSKGRNTIPSDTACYPAKLMHGHMEDLLEQGVDTIFYPCMSYNFDEGKGDNHYNCPVVAYYPELLWANILKLRKIQYMTPYFGLHRRQDFERKAWEYFGEYIPKLKKGEIKRASQRAYRAYDDWQQELKKEGREAIAYAREHGLDMVVLAGRPYHVDPEINHGIDRLITSFHLAVLTEDSVADLTTPQEVQVLNQWTYHTRLYNAAKFVTEQNDVHLIQLVSFGCGIDAITTDEVRSILERGDKLYTQIKIDEMNNLGAVKIRIRSLLGAVEERKKAQKQQKEGGLYAD